MLNCFLKNGANGEIIAITRRTTSKTRVRLPKTFPPKDEVDERHVHRAGFPDVTVGVFHIYPLHEGQMGAVEEERNLHVLPLVRECRCDPLTGDGDKSANTQTKNQQAYRPDLGLRTAIARLLERLPQHGQDRRGGCVPRLIGESPQHCPQCSSSYGRPFLIAW